MIAVKHIVLIGMMGAGKSTCGALLGKKLGRTVVDTDTLIEQQTGRTISELFASEGEAYFRDLETQLVHELAEQHNLIIATGGGLPLREVNRKVLKENGIVFWLKRDPAETYRAGAMEHRPLAQQGLKSFVERFQMRTPFYEMAADYVIESGTTPEETVDEIVRCLCRRNDW